MNLFSISSISAAVLCLIVSFVCFYTRKTKSHIALGWTTFLVAIWSLFPFLTTIIHAADIQLLTSRIIYMAAGPAPFAFMYLTISIFESPPTKFEKFLIKACVFMSTFFALAAYHEAFIVGVGSNGPVRFVIPGPLFYLFIFYFIVICGWTFWRMIKEYPKTRGLKRNQLKYFFGGFGIAYVGGAIHFLTSFLKIEIFPHDVLVATCTIILGYAILRYRLMDFNLIMRWGLAYFILMIAISLIAIPIIAGSEILASKYLNIQKGVLTLVSAGTLIFLLPPLRQKITYFVDQIIFRSPDFQSILNGIEETIKCSNDIEILSTNLIKKLKSIWGVNHAGLILWNFNIASYALFPTKEFENQIITRLQESIKKTDFLVRTLESERRLFWGGVVVEDEINSLINRAFPGEKTTLEKIRRTMRWLGAVICVPLMINNALAGFLVLGRKQNDNLYNMEDKKFLSHLVELISPTINAVQNMKSISA